MTRQEAIQALKDILEEATSDKYAVCYVTSEDAEAINMAIEALSADAVQGEWIDIDNYYRMATCSHCHKVTMFEKWGEYTRPYNFCPNCGAKMKGAEHEVD